MHYHLDTLFNLIRRHQSNNLLETDINQLRENITRQARIIHLSTTQETITTAQKEKIDSENKLAHASAAQQFLLWRTTQQESTLNYALIATWADSDNCKLNDKLILSTQSWLAHFSQILATQEPATGLIPLALNYFYEPQKLTAFLMWLLSKNTRPKRIMQSNLLHRFFLMHMISMEAKEDNLLDALYKNLVSFSAVNTGIKNLINLATKTIIRLSNTCNFEITKNDKKHYESHTLLAPLLETVDENNEPTVARKRHIHNNAVTVIPLNDLQDQPPLSFKKKKKNIKKLYDLFQIDFIHALNLEIEPYAKTLEWLLRNKRTALPTLLQQIKNNYIPFVKAIELLSIIYTSITLTELIPVSSPAIQLYFLALNNESIPVDKIREHIKSLISIDAPYSWTELLLLIHAFKKLFEPTEDRAPFDSKSLYTLQRHIFNHALKGDVYHNDELENAICEFPDLTNLCTDKIKELKNAFDDAFCIQSPFDSLRNKWSELLPIVNFLKRLTPEIVNYPYPFSIYQLWSEVLKKTWLYTQTDAAEFNLNGFIENHAHQYHDTSNLKRILLESLIQLHIPDLLEKITHYLENKNISWWKECWEDSDSVIQKAIKRENNALFDLITENHFEENYTDTLLFSIQCCNLHAVQRLLAMETQAVDPGIIPRFYTIAIELESWSILSELVANKKTQKTESITNALTTAKKEKNWSCIKCLIPFINNKKEVTFLLRQALADNRWDIIQSIISLSGKNRPAKNALYAVIDKALEHEEWDILLLLITQKSANKISQEEVSFILKGAVDSNN